ncbi:MAG: formate dehydrogenase accessory sulfurtransferase FdhD [Candidatus Poseidoniaceae archaeon]|nr:formate dehydrogenase accessory sulfurtransferase FdhD [Candidatus Poseidoniaceae archaeon]
MRNDIHHIPLQRITESGSSIEKESVVVETAIQLNALDENGQLFTHATLLATPIDLIELHAGHILSEGYTFDTLTKESFVHIDTPYHTIQYEGRLNATVRKRPVTSSCGACNHPDLLVSNVHGVIDSSAFVDLDLQFIHDALEKLTTNMHLFQESGACHGAGLLFLDEGLRFVSEDIGRHNAVDKTIGKATLAGTADFNNALILLSGRCGWDIVAKAVRSGIPAIASIGAFSSAAVQLAREHGVTLFGFVKNDGAWKAGY